MANRGRAVENVSNENIRIPHAVEMIEYHGAGFTAEQQVRQRRPIFCPVCRKDGLSSFPDPKGCSVCQEQGVVMLLPPTHRTFQK